MTVADLKARLTNAQDTDEVHIVDTDGLEYELDGATVNDGCVHLSMGGEIEEK